MIPSDRAEPLVSVIMPVRNCERFLSEAIASILNQTLRDFELLVVDDGSTDASAEIAAQFEDPRVTVTKQSASGVGRARNAALAAARGQFIGFMDGDDIADKERLAAQVEFLRRHPRVGMVGTWTGHIDSSGNGASLPPQRPPCDDASIRLEMLDDSGFCCTSVLYRRGALDGLRFREDLTYAEDYELTLRLIHRTEAANIPRYLYLYRQHETSATAKLDETAKRAARESIRAGMLQTMARSLQHRGARNSSIQDRCADVYDDSLVRRTAYAWFLRAAATGRFRLSATFLSLMFRRGEPPSGLEVAEGLRAALALHRQLGIGRTLAAVARKSIRLRIDRPRRG